MAWLAAATSGLRASADESETSKANPAGAAAAATATALKGAAAAELKAAAASTATELKAAAAASTEAELKSAAAATLGIPSSVLVSPQSSRSSFSPAISVSLSPVLAGDAAAAVAVAVAEAAEAAASAEAKQVWMQRTASVTGLQQLQELKESRTKKKQKQQQMQQQQQQRQRQQMQQQQMQQQQMRQQQMRQQQMQQQQMQQQQQSVTAEDIAKPHGRPVDYRGRPLHDVEHADFKSSLLSHHSYNLNLRGFFNLFFIILVIVNASLVTENILTYGGLLQVPRSFEDLSKNWPVLCCFILMHLCIVGAYVIERFVAPASGRVFDVFLFSLIFVNLALLCGMPFLTVRSYQPEPVAGLLLLSFSIVWAFKFLSMHHTCLDTRRAMLRGDNFLVLCNGREEEARAAACYPYSITLRHVYRFTVLPSMCFQFHYPFTPCIRWFSVFRHAAESAVCLAMMKIVVDKYISAIVRDSFTITQLQTIPLSVLVSHFFRQMIRLSIPNLYVWLLMFVGLFHHWCNILAEITRFGDREFYLDWWNASSFGEYWRKWNLPIHFFLHRHVNKPLLRNGVSKFFAVSVVFCISALMHEYIVVVPLQLGWTSFIFLAFLGQIPLMYFTNIQFFQDNPTVGNCFFWLVFCFTGQPLGILLYWYLWGVKHGAVAELDPSRIALS